METYAKSPNVIFKVEYLGEVAGSKADESRNSIIFECTF